MLKGMMKALKYGMALCMAVSLSAYIPEIGVQEVKATEVTASAEEKWSGTISATPPKNDGNTYHIYTGEELAWVAQQTREGISFEGKTIILENDIDLDFIPWKPIGVDRVQPFKGTFEGNGKTITNLMLTNNEEGLFEGLFGVTRNGLLQNFSIKNVKFQDSDISYHNLGIVSADVLQSKVINVHVENAEILASGTSLAPVGGITCVLSNSSWIINCSVKNSTLQGRNIGGIVSDWEPITDETVFGKYGPGGIVNCASINNQLQLTYPSPTDNIVIAGGIISNIESRIKDFSVIGSLYFLNNYSTSTITATDIVADREIRIGGLIGLVDSPIVLEMKNNYAASSVINDVASKDTTGAVIGLNNTNKLSSDNIFYSGSAANGLPAIGKDAGSYGSTMMSKTEESMKNESFAKSLTANIDSLSTTIMPLDPQGKRYTYNPWAGAEGVWPAFTIPAVTDIDIYPVLSDNGQEIVYVNQNGSVQLHSTLLPYYASREANPTWRVSPDTSGVSVDANGLVSANNSAVGTEVDLIASYGEITKTVKVRIVEKDAITSLRINTPSDLLVGTTKRLSVTTTPINANKSSVKWYIDLNPAGLENLVTESEIASIDSDTGIIKGLKAGQVTVVAKIEGTSIRDSYTMTIQDTQWDGVASRQPDFYDDAYHITMASELKWIADSVNNGNTFADKKILLETNIDLGKNNSFVWTPIGSNGNYFSGIFDGQGYSISHILIDDTNVLNGLFGWINNAAIKNITIRDISIQNELPDSYNGALAAQAQDTEINGVTAVDVSINTTGTAGGLIGLSQYNVSLNHTAVLNSDITSRIGGGLIGKAIAYNGKVINSFTEGKLTAHQSSLDWVNLGGIIGTVIGSDNASLESTAATAFTIQNSYTHSVINSTLSNPGFAVYTGGLVGQVNSYIALENNYSNSDLTNHVNANRPGGIIGYAQPTNGYYTSIVNNAWNEEKRFENASGEIAVENKKSVGNQGSIIIDSTTLEDMMKRCSDAYMKAASSEEKALVNDLNENLPENGSMWINGTEGYPQLSDSESFTVVLKKDYIQMRRNESVLLEPVMRPYVAGKDLSYEWHVLSGNDTISVDQFGRVTVSDSAITHQSAIIEMIVKEKGAEICRDTAQIVVLEDEAAVQSLTIKDPGVIKVGDTVKLKAEVEPESVDTSGLYFKVKKINDYAEVSADGTLIAYKAGTFTVQAILDGVIAERIITIKSGTKWDGVTVDEPDSDGNYIYITKPSELAWIAQQAYEDRYNWFEGKTLILQNDIDLNNQNWMPILIFKGNFDGRGHTIKNISIGASPGINQFGLFGVVRNAEIKNLILDTVNMNLDEVSGINNFGAGSLFAYAYDSNITNIKVKNAYVKADDTEVNTPMIGGLGGDVINVNIDNCSVENSTVIGKTNSLGGIIGEVTGASTYFSMKNCFAKNVTMQDGCYIGGLVGYINQSDSSNRTAIIKNCYAEVIYNTTNKYLINTSYIGAISGIIQTKYPVLIENVYSVLKVNNSVDKKLIAGNLVGIEKSQDLKLNNVYYNSQTSGLTIDMKEEGKVTRNNVEGMTTDVMKSPSSSADNLINKLNTWVSNSVEKFNTWTIQKEGYPYFGLPDVESIKVLPVVKEVYPGETLQLEKEILPFGASDVAVKYTSNNPKVQVDNNGLVKVINEFTNTYVATITMIPLDSKYPSSTSTLIVMQPKPEITSIKITVLEEGIETNKVYSLSASILPLDADPNQIKWSIINNVNTQAILSDKGLLDTGSVAGSITVRAESINNPNIYDVITLNIKSKHDFGIAWDGSAEKIEPVNNVIHIVNPKQLAYIAQQTKAGITYEGISIYLDSDLDLGNKNWTPIGSLEYGNFMGKFYGNNHTIKNLTITSLSDTTMVGLFGLVKNGEIHDLYLTDVNIKLDKFNVAGTDQVGYGTLVSNVYGNDTTYIISNVHVSNVQVYGPSSSRVTLPSGMIGIVYGRAEIDNCSVDNAYVEGYPNSTGGLLAEVSNGAGKYLKITNSSVSNTTLVNGTHTGAIIGYWGSVTGDSHLMENCYSNNVVFVNTNVNVGGLVGRTDGAVLKIIRNCYSVTSSKNTNTEAKTVKGIIGSINGNTKLENCYYDNDDGKVAYSGNSTISETNVIGMSSSVIKNNITQTPNLVNKLNDWVKAQPNSDDYLTWRVNDSTPELGPKSKITLNQDQLILKTNETAVLNATITGENINSIVAWSSSQPSVAAIDENGKITAKIPGRAVITATSQDGQIAQAKVEVQALTTSVVLSFIDPEHTTQLKVGDSVGLQAALQPIDEALTWNSSDPSVIAIQVDSENDKLAKITALKAGTAEVSAQTAEGVKGTLQFTVGNPVTSIQIEGNNTMDLAHPTQKLKGFVNDDATDQRISWSIKKKVDENYEETSDAVISETGTVTVSALGSYQVTAAAMDGTDMTAVFTIEVVPAVVDSVKIILPEGQGYLSGQIGSSIDLKAEVTPSLVLAEDAQLHYESSDPTRFMIIEEDGQTKVKISDQAKIGDLAQITLTSGIGKDSNVMDTVTVMVAWTKVESLTIINTETNEAYSEEVPTDLGKGSIIKLKAKPIPEAATNPSVTWRVENVDDTLQTPLAEIDENGYLTLKTPGEIRVTATSLEDGTIIANARINIVEIYPTSISILEGSKEIGVDQNIDYLQLTVNFEPAETTNKKLIFTSSNPAVASVDSMGRITFVKGEGKNVLGDTEITITPEVDSRLDEALQAKPIKITIKVSDQVIYVESIDEILTSAGLPLADTIVRVGDDLNLIASYLPTHASARNFEWEVVTPEGEEALVSIHDGKLTALKAGTATIRCSVEGKISQGTVETLSIERKVVIQEAVARSISFDALSLTLMPGVSQNITASVNPIGKVSQKIKWSSPNSQIIFTDLQGTALNGAIEGPVKVKANENAIAGQTITVIAESEALDIDGNPLRRELQVFIGNVKATAVTPNRTAITMVAEGDTQQLRATVYGANGLKATNQNVTWSSDYPEIASVDAFGTVTPHRAGTAKITVTSADGGFSAVCTVTVTAASLKELKLSETSITMIKGNEKELTAIVNEGSGITDFLWESSEPTIVEIKGSGKTVQLIAKAPGSAVITATAGNKQASAAVRVVNNEVLIQSIELSGPASGEVGETVLITASIQGTDGNEATNKTLKWHVSDNNAVTVLDETSSIGRFKINKEAGNVIITAEACDGSQVSAQFTLKTTGITASGLTLNNSFVKLGSKDMTGFDIIATITPESVADKTVTWTVDKQNIIELTANGSSAHIRPAAGVVPGENSYAIITAKTANGKSAQCVVLITEVKLEAIQLGKSSITIIEGDEKELPIQIKPAETTNTELIWEIDETGNGMYEEVNSSSAVQISTMNGIYTVKAQPLPEAMNTKEVTIRARAKANTEIISNLCKITIQEDPLVSIEIIGPTELLVDNSAHYSLLAVPYDALISDVSWQVIEEMNPDGSEYVPDDKDENPELKNHIVQIIQEGVLKGIKEGRAVIQVSTGNGISAQLEITVTSSMTPPEITDSVDEIRIKKLPDGIEIDSLEMISSEIKQLGVAFYNHGTLVSDPKASEIIWSCSDETGDYLTIDPRTGVITAKAVSPKPITITALSKYTKQIPSEIEGEEDLTVSVLASIPVTIHEQAGLIKSLSLDPSATSLAFNKKQIMTAYASYTGNKEDLSIQWESSDPTIVKVTPMEDPLQASIETFGKAGTAVIMLTVNGTTAFANVIVSAEAKTPVTSISVKDELGNDLSGILEMKQGTTLQVIAEADEAASNPNLIFSTSEDTIASVDENGLIHALSPGVAMITISPADTESRVSKTLVIQVNEIPEYKISLNKTEITMESGSDAMLVALLTPSLTEEASIKYEWSISDLDGNPLTEATITLDSASENPESVHLTANSVSQETNVIVNLKATISESGNEDKVLTQSCTVHIMEAIASITDIQWTSDLIVDDALTMILDDQGCEEQIGIKIIADGEGTAYVNWTTSAPEIVSVTGNASGAVLKAYQPGTADITMTSAKGGFTKTLKVTVRKVVIESLDFTLNDGQIEVGAVTEGFLVLNADPSEKNESEKAKVQFKSSNPDIASVAVDETGKIKIMGLKEGKATIIAMSPTAPDKMVTADITVVKPALLPYLINQFELLDRQGRVISTHTEIDSLSGKIIVTVPLLTDKSALIARFGLSYKGSEADMNKADVLVANVPQSSGVTVNDYTNTLTYVVKDKENDENTKDYMVLVVDEAIPDKDAVMTSFTFKGVEPCETVIEGNTITVKVDETTDLTQLVAVFEAENVLSVTTANGEQISGESVNDFSKPLTYILFGKNKKSISYTVKVDTGPELTSIKLKQGENSLEGQWDIERECYVFTVPALVQIDYDQPFILEWTPDTLTHSGSLNLNLNEMQSVPFIYADQFTRT
ncbi:Ig-like domain-containing protein, partial [Dielma fastidiosa]|uniref:Ig-like domain-containing protein n=2 Tax=Dielma fastidiosa TaxID=1034346 RepID=UPI00047EDAD6